MRRAGWTLMWLLASVIALYAAAVLLVPGFGPPFIGALRMTAPLAVVAHLAGSIVALAVGAWQLNGRLRARAIAVHRWMGRAYVAGVMSGGLGGLALARTSQEGLVTHIGFGLLAVLWLGCTIAGYLSIRRWDEPSHRAWMMPIVSPRVRSLNLSTSVGIALYEVARQRREKCRVPERPAGV